MVLATSGEHSDAYFEVVEELYFNARGFSGPADPRVRADLTLVSLPSGGAVFSVGSIAWCGALSSDGYDNPVSKLMSNVIERFLDPDSTCCPGRHPRGTELIGPIRSQPARSALAMDDHRSSHGAAVSNDRHASSRSASANLRATISHRSVGRRRSTRQEATPPGGRSC